MQGQGEQIREGGKQRDALFVDFWWEYVESGKGEVKR